MNDDGIKRIEPRQAFVRIYGAANSEEFNLRLRTREPEPESYEPDFSEKPKRKPKKPWFLRSAMAMLSVISPPISIKLPSTKIPPPTSGEKQFFTTERASKMRVPLKPGDGPVLSTAKPPPIPSPSNMIFSNSSVP